MVYDLPGGKGGVSPRQELNIVDSHWVDQEAEVGLENRDGTFKPAFPPPPTCFLLQVPVSTETVSPAKG